MFLGGYSDNGYRGDWAFLSSNWNKPQLCILSNSAAAHILRLEMANFFFSQQQNGFRRVWWIQPEMDDFSAEDFCAPLLCFFFFLKGREYHAVLQHWLSKWEKKGIVLEVCGGGGRRKRRAALKNETSAKAGDTCPSWIGGTLKCQMEAGILPAGQFENNQCELLTSSSWQDGASGTIVHVSST